VGVGGVARDVTMMYDMLVGGAVSAALIPVLSGYIARDDEETGWKVVGTL